MLVGLVGLAGPVQATPQPLTTSPSPGTGCRTDAECTPGTICEARDGRARRCVPVRKHINVLYLFYRSADRRFTQLGGLYWHRRLPRRGYRLGLPLYYHFYNDEQQTSTRLLFPLLLHRRHGPRSDLLVGPLQLRHGPGERDVRLWPLVFYSSRAADTSRSLTIAPLLHRRSYPTGSETLLPPLLSYLRRDTARELSQGLLLGMVYWRRTPDERAHALFPLWYHRRSSAAGHPHRVTRSFTWALPLTFYRRRGAARSLLTLTPPLLYRAAPGRKTLLTLVPPLYYSRNGATRSFVLPPLLAWYRAPGASFTLAGPAYWRHDGQRSGFGVAPLLFYGRDRAQDHQHLVLFPALWQWRTGQRRGLVAGPYYDLRGPLHRRAGLAPLVFYHRSPGQRRLSVLPLLHYRRDGHLADGRRRTLLLSPLGFYRSERHTEDPARDRWSLLAGPWYSSRSPSRRLDLFAPLFYRDENRRRDTSLLLAGPYFSWRDGSGAQARTTRALLPLLWRRSAPEAHTTVAAPLGFSHRRRDGSLSLDLWGPLYLRRSTRGFAASLLPLAFVGADRVARSHYGVLFPVLWRFGDVDATTTVLGPAYYHRHGQGYHAGLAPLLFAGRRRQRGYQIAFPAFWRFTDRARQRSTTVAGPAFWSRSPSGYHAGLAPLLFAGRRRQRGYQIAFPAFWRFTDGARQRSTTVAGPFYYRTTRRGDSVRAGLLPLFHYAHDQGGAERTVIAFPLLLHRRSPGRQRTLTPLFGWQRDHRGHRRRRSGYAGPVFWQRRGERLRAGLGLTHAVPLAWFERRAADDKALTVAPLFWGRWRRHRTSVTLLPVFHYGSRGGNHHRETALYTPLFGFSRARGASDSSTFYLLPYVGHRSRRSTLDVLLPLGLRHRDHHRQRSTVAVLGAYYGRWSAQRSLHITPLVSVARDRAKGTAATVVFPLFWDFKSDGSAFGQPRRATVALPFYWRFARAERRTTVVFPLYWDVVRQGKRTTTLFPVYWRVARPGHRTHVVLNAYYRRSLRDGTYDFHLVPLFRIARQRPGDLKWAALGGLFGFQRVGRNRYLKLMFISFPLSPLPRSTQVALKH